MKGVELSPGVAIGRALHLDESEINLSEEFCENPEKELLRLEESLQVSEAQLQSLREQTKEKQGEEEAQIFDAHILLLKDPAFLKKIKALICSQQFSAPFAYQTEATKVIIQFQALEDPYFKERALDIEDISKRVLRNLLGIQEFSLANVKEDTILVAKDLTPSETAAIDPRYIKGIITETAGKTSHFAIMARTLEIPAIGGVKNIFESIPANDLVALNCEEKEVILDPTKVQIEELRKKQDTIQEEKESLQSLKGQPSVTKDNHLVHLYANIGQEENIDLLVENDAEGVGLFRTEFLYMQASKAPSEEAQFNVYKKALTALSGKPVILRTLDIGGDKNIDYLNFPKEENPFLGQRAIRYCFENLDLFKTQLRAALRASAYGPLKVMFPMVSCLEDLREAKEILSDCKKELTLKNIDFDSNIQVGVMIEIPSAAYASDLLAEEADFFSIGTNDLIQYMMAADRNNEKVSSFYSHYQPSVLRIINLVIRNAKKAGIPVGMCGSMAADLTLTNVLLGMGLESFSMEPTSILKARKKINALSFKEAQKERDKVLAMTTKAEIKAYLYSQGRV